MANPNPHRGGLRPNAGRKKANHTIQAEAMRAYLIAQVHAEQEPIVKALIDKAKAGDVPALKEILERTLGKVKDNIDLNVAFSLSKLFNQSRNDGG